MSKKSIFYTTADLNYSDVSPTLDLNFVENQKVPPFVNVTRNSQTTYVDKFGILRTADINQPVFEWDPITGKCLGARIWGAVTNQIRNNTNVGAVVGTPGTLPTNWTSATPSNGLSRQIVGVGTVNGVDYIDIRYFGTTTATLSTNIQFESQTLVTAASGETWTGSVYLAIVGGSSSNINDPARLRVTGRNTSGTLQESQQTDNTIDSRLVRRSTTATFSNVNTTRVTLDFIFTYNSGVVIDVTYRIGLPQLEKSATMGPVVKTTGTAASSTAGVWTITGADYSRIINQAEGTIYIEYGPHDATTPASNNSLFTITDSTTSAANIIESFAGSNIAPVLRIESKGVNQAYISSSAYNPSAIHKLAAAYKEKDFARSIDTQSLGTGTSGALPDVAPSILEIGSRSFGGVKPLNGYIRRLTIYPKRLTNSQLVQLTE